MTHGNEMSCWKESTKRAKKSKSSLTKVYFWWLIRQDSLTTLSILMVHICFDLLDPRWVYKRMENPQESDHSVPLSPIKKTLSFISHTHTLTAPRGFWRRSSPNCPDLIPNLAWGVQQLTQPLEAVLESIWGMKASSSSTSFKTGPIEGCWGFFRVRNSVIVASQFLESEMVASRFSKLRMVASKLLELRMVASRLSELRWDVQGILIS